MALKRIKEFSQNYIIIKMYILLNSKTKHKVS